MAQPLGEGILAAIPSEQIEITPVPAIPQPRAPLRLVPTEVEAVPQLPDAATLREQLFGIIYAAERGVYENLVDSEAFLSHYDFHSHVTPSAGEIPAPRDPKYTYTHPDRLRITHAKEL